MPSVRPHLWFDNGKAVEAARFYAEHIPNSSVHKVLKAPAGMPNIPEGGDFIVEFTVGGLPVIAINAGPDFRLDEAFSFYLSVQTQEEVDHYWELLTADGGEPGPCGWCKDRFGVSWQVVPERLDELCGDYTTEANLRVLRAMFSMTKLDLDALEKAYVGAA
jgi:predicted 3-demethylubiquinone-9 3-methyltransferase (glyoxalase superfamily)